jgi:hypothetical protein
MKPRQNVNATAPYPTSTPWKEAGPPVSTVVIAANNYRPNTMDVGPVTIQPTNWGGTGTGLPSGGERTFADQLNGLTYGAAEGLPVAHVPRWTPLPYGKPTPQGGNRAPANDMRPAKAGISTAGPAAPVTSAPPGPSYLRPTRTTP